MSETRRKRDLSEILSADEIIAIERKRIARLLEADWLETGPWQNHDGFETHGDPYVRIRRTILRIP